MRCNKGFSKGKYFGDSLRNSKASCLWPTLIFPVQFSLSPQGTLIIQNLNSVLYEEGQWKTPHGFHPENFLNDGGEFVKPEAFVPFSAGTREQTPPFHVRR